MGQDTYMTVLKYYLIFYNPICSQDLQIRNSEPHSRGRNICEVLPSRQPHLPGLHPGPSVSILSARETAVSDADFLDGSR